jgi:hypothetical protein
VSEGQKRLQWGGPPETPPPTRPYRDSAILYAVLAVVIVAVAWITGGGLARAVGIAVFFFVIATSWSFWRWRQRLERAPQEPLRGVDPHDRERN